MFSEDKVTEIFYLADEFCKFFNAQQEKSMLGAPKDGKKHRRKPNRMSDAEIIVILIHFHSGGFRCFKHYWKIRFHMGIEIIRRMLIGVRLNPRNVVKN